MARCIHFHDAGVRCLSEAVTDSEFCVDHQTHDLVPATPEVPRGHLFRKLILRLVAILLLLMLLIPFYRVVRALFSTYEFEMVQTQ